MATSGVPAMGIPLYRDVRPAVTFGWPKAHIGSYERGSEMSIYPI